MLPEPIKIHHADFAHIEHEAQRLALMLNRGVGLDRIKIVVQEINEVLRRLRLAHESETYANNPPHPNKPTGATHATH